MAAGPCDRGRTAPDGRADHTTSAADRRIPFAIWLLVGLQLLLALGWSQLAPPWRAPDEPQHHDRVRAAGAGDVWVGPDRVLSAQITATFDRVAFTYNGVRALDPLAADDAPARAGRRPFDALADDEPSWAANWLWQHPPLYYLVTAGVVASAEGLLPAPLGWLTEVSLARAASAVMIAPLPLLVWLVARRLDATAPAALGAATLAPAVPQLTHLGGAVNNDNLHTLLVGIATVPLVGMATGDRRLRQPLTAGGLLGAALLAKGFALIGVALLPAAAAAGWLKRRRHRHAGREALVSAGLGLVAMMVLGGWWLVHNLLRYQALVPSSHSLEPEPYFTPQLGSWLVEAVPRLVQRFWGSFGWFQAEIPMPVAVAASVVLVALVAVALARQRSLSRLAAAAVAVAPAVALLGGVGYQAWLLHASYGGLPLIQGRYLQAGLVGVFAVTALALDTRRHRWMAAWPLLALAAVVVLQAVSVATVLDEFWVGDGAGALAAVLAWSAWPLQLWVGWVVALTVVTVGVATAGVGQLIPARAAQPAGSDADVRRRR